MADSTRKLEEDLKKLIFLAKENGLSDADIDECIAEVLDDPKANYKTVQESRIFYKLIRKCSLISFKMLMLFFGFVIVVNVVVTVAPNRVKVMMVKHLHPYYYQLQRLIRLTTLPLHDYFNLTEYYFGECLINNPVFNPMRENETEGQCDYCDMLKIPIPQVDNASEAHPTTLIVVYLENVTPVSVQDMVRFYDDKNGTVKLKSNGQLHGHLTDIVDLGAPASELSHLRTSWTSSGADVGELVGLPAYLEKGTPVDEMFSFYAFGPNANYISLGQNEWKSRAISQLSGTTEVFFEPLELECHERCGHHRIMLNSGHSVRYHSYLWEARLRSNSSSGIALSFTVDFDWQEDSAETAPFLSTGVDDTLTNDEMEKPDLEPKMENTEPGPEIEDTEPLDLEMEDKEPDV